MHNLSQFNEDQIILNYFGDHVGFFVDVGASSGVALSNTFYLGLKHWKGLLVEASPTHFATLMANYVNRGGIELVNAAIWTERKMMRFFFNQWFYSSLIEKKEAGLYQACYWVQTCTADDLKAIQPECDVLSLDIENADIIVFPSLMAAYPKCRLVVVEHAKDPGLKARWMEQFAKFKLQVIAETPENYIAVKKV